MTINDQAGELDAGLTDKVDVALTGTTSPLVLSDAQALRCMVLKLTGTHPGGAYEVHCPTNRKIGSIFRAPRPTTRSSPCTPRSTMPRRSGTSSR